MVPPRCLFLVFTFSGNKYLIDFFKTKIGNEEWKEDPRSDLYDHTLIQHRLASLKCVLGDAICSPSAYDRFHSCREAMMTLKEDRSALVWLLRTGLHRKLGGIGNPRLYSRCAHLRFFHDILGTNPPCLSSRVHVGTKNLIDEYVSTVAEALDSLLSDTTFPLRVLIPLFQSRLQLLSMTPLLYLLGQV